MKEGDKNGNKTAGGNHNVCHRRSQHRSVYYVIVSVKRRAVCTINMSAASFLPGTNKFYHINSSGVNLRGNSDTAILYSRYQAAKKRVQRATRRGLPAAPPRVVWLGLCLEIRITQARLGANYDYTTTTFGKKCSDCQKQ